MKLIAMTGLLLCCTILGFFEAAKQAARVKKLLLLRDDLTALKGELRLHRRPIGQAITAVCHNEQLRAAGQAMICFPGRDANLSIEEQFHGADEKELRELLGALFETLTYADEEACREALDRCIEALDHLYHSSEQRRTKNEPLQRWGPLLAGGVICILLW